MTNETDIEGVFGSFSWFKDVSDSEVHFQGPKWGFTLIFAQSDELGGYMGESLFYKDKI